jgi:hypothetical protein
MAEFIEGCAEIASAVLVGLAFTAVSLFLIATMTGIVQW